MKIPPLLAKFASISAGVWLVAGLATGCKKAPPPPAPKPASAAVKPAADSAASNAAAASYVSVFEDLLPPKGRDPFFPDSHRREPSPPPVVLAPHQAPMASDLLLKGIVGSATHRLAVINNEILEVGEESPVRVPNGQVRVRCVEIGEDYAVIKVDGEARTQRLEMQKKNY